MVRCQSILLLSTCSLLLSTCFAFIPSNHPALIASCRYHQSLHLFSRDSSYHKPDTALYARAKIPSKQNTRAKTPSKQAVKKLPFQRAKTPSKQIVKKKPFQRAKPPSKQIVKKKPFQRAKTPSKQIVKKKPFQRAKTPSKQIVKKKRKRRAKTSALVESLLGQVIIVGATLTVTLTAALFLSYSYIKPSSSIGVITGKAPDITKVKKNVIGKRKPTKAPKEYDLDLGILQEKKAAKETKEEPVEEKKPAATSPEAAS